ncbi:hypothetical protein CNMCM5623_005461 [Aspergillus felis]|uniref:Exocyst complex component Sec10 n=1 Tax=Aspergillus felis TaxID=1287682 RepID=A0A8H6QZ00_9EURO|nr:hypothetical protein CNMCM5623_005461 [Aspergillus felis]KAF7182034.1 hypothetical protein CNMCM7691_001422 [Aspergillus felis]
MSDSVSTTPQSNPASRSIFPKGPNFTLSDFSSRDYIVKEFIEALSDSTSSNRRSTLGPGPGNQLFDPKPLIRAFEHAQRRLGELSGDLEIKENELSAAARRAEAQHAQNLGTLGRKLKQTIDSFQQLDTSLNGAGLSGGELPGATGNMAVETGRRLEELDRQRRRALDAHFLIQCWDGRLDPRSWDELRAKEDDLYRNDDVSVDEGTRGNINGTHRNTREIIEKFSETLEKDLLKQFDDFYRKANFEGMRDCATVLQDFSGGASVTALFVNQHQFFIDRSQLVTEEVGGDLNSWEQLADPDAEPLKVEPSLQSLVDEVKVVVQEESAIIKRAFPFYEQVLGKFLQRVFQQSIQQRLEMVLEKANGISSLAFLRSLQSSRSYISGLVDDLKTHGLTEHPDPVSSQTALILDQQLEDLFVPYFVGSSYIEREKKSLEELYTSLLFRFTTFHARRKRAATTFMASISKSGTELLSSARDAYVNRLESSEFTPTQKKMLLQLAGLKDQSDSMKPAEIKLMEKDGLPNITYAKRMLKWLAEAVGRGLELGATSETPKDVSALLNLLLSSMGESYVEVCLDAVLESATSQESARAEPDFGYLTVVKSIISITNLMVMCIQTLLIPLATPSITIRREMEKKTNTATLRIEDKINAIEQKVIDTALIWVSRLLSGQKKNDFRPKEGDNAAWLEMLHTPTCASICAFLTRLHDTIAATLSSSGSNFRHLLTEIALGTRSHLLEHFKRYAVNGAGGLMVTKDMTQYADLLKSWDIDEHIKGPGGSLDVLLEVGSLFVIGPEALLERIRGGASSNASRRPGTNRTETEREQELVGTGQIEPGLSVQEFRAYVSRREDSSTTAMQHVLNLL